MYDIFNVFFTLKFSGDQLMNTWELIADSLVDQSSSDGKSQK